MTTPSHSNKPVFFWHDLIELLGDDYAAVLDYEFDTSKPPSVEDLTVCANAIPEIDEETRIDLAVLILDDDACTNAIAIDLAGMIEHVDSRDVPRLMVKILGQARGNEELEAAVRDQADHIVSHTLRSLVQDHVSTPEDPLLNALRNTLNQRAQNDKSLSLE